MLFRSDSGTERTVEDGARSDGRVRGEEKSEMSLDLGAGPECYDILWHSLDGKQETRSKKGA